MDEFFRRVDAGRATEHASAVMRVLGEAIEEEELGDVRERLPQEFYQYHPFAVCA